MIDVGDLFNFFRGVLSWVLDNLEITIIAAVIFIAVWIAAKKLLGRRGKKRTGEEAVEEKVPLSARGGELFIPEGKKNYDLLVNPKAFNDLKHLLVEKGIKPHMDTKKDGLHFIFDSEKKLYCDKMIEAGLLLDFVITPLENQEVFEKVEYEEKARQLESSDIMEEKSMSHEKKEKKEKIEQVSVEKVVEPKPKEEQKDERAISIMLTFDETVPSDWTIDDIKKQMQFKYKALLKTVENPQFKIVG